MSLPHLQRLEAEAIHIMREVVSEAERPVMLYSIGKDSSVMLRLALKAFHPAKPPFPLLHIDTTWKFRAMYEFGDRMVRELGLAGQPTCGQRAAREALKTSSVRAPATSPCLTRETTLVQFRSVVISRYRARMMLSIRRTERPPRMAGSCHTVAAR